MKQPQLFAMHRTFTSYLMISLFLTGCAGRTGDIPEISDQLRSGKVVLNVDGAGYRIGDIVTIDTDVSDLSEGDVILFDWRKAASGRTGFGPTSMIGKVVGMPGDSLYMAKIKEYRGSDGKTRVPWFGTFQRCGARTYDDAIVLPEGNYLVETAGDILVVDEASAGARVIRKVGHDDRVEKEIRQRVY